MTCNGMVATPLTLGWPFSCRAILFPAGQFYAVLSSTARPRSCFALAASAVLDGPDLPLRDDPMPSGPLHSVTVHDSLAPALLSIALRFSPLNSATAVTLLCSALQSASCHSSLLPGTLHLRLDLLLGDFNRLEDYVEGVAVLLVAILPTLDLVESTL